MKKHCIWLLLFLGGVFRYASYLRSPLSNPNVPVGAVFSDEIYYYIPVMQYILNFGWINYFTNEISVMFAGGNPIYLVFLQSIFGDDFQILRQVNIIVSCVTIFILYKLARNIFNENVALLTAAFSCFNSVWIPYSYTLMTEVPFLLFLILALFLYTKSIGCTITTAKACIIAGFLFWAALTRGIITLLPFFLLICYGLLYWYKRSDYMENKFRQIVLIVILFSIMLFPMIAKNHALFHANTLSVGSGAVLWIGSRIDTDGDEPPYRGVPYDPVIFNEVIAITGGLMHFTIDGDKLLKEAAIENIKQSLPEYFLMSMKKIARLTVGNNYAWFYSYGSNLFEYYQSQGFFPTLEKMATISFYVYIYVFGLASIRRSMYEEKAQLLIFTMLYFLIFSIPFLSIVRYGFPIFMLISIFAANETIFLLKHKLKKDIYVSIGIVMSISTYICLGI